jgi:hypothetical protein
MPVSIEAKEIPLANLLGPDFFFNIPVYQRPFSWTEEHFNQLFEDISNAMTNNLDQYFIGSTVLQEIGKNTYDLVDGQQRLTAITILLAVIRDATSNEDLRKKLQSYLYQEEDKWKEIPERMRITPWEELKGLFKEYIYKIGGTEKFLTDFYAKKIQYADQEDPRYHIFEAIATFREKVKDHPDVEGLVKYTLNRVYKVYIMTNTQTSAFRLFNVLNSRGLPLEPCDLLKSENLGAIQESVTRDKYAKVWRSIEEDIGREELSKVIGFIRTIKLKEKAQLGIYEEFQKIFKNGLLTRGIEFIDYLKEIVDIYREKVLEGQINIGSSEEQNNYRVTIDLLLRFVPFSDWIPPLLAFSYKFDSDQALISFLMKLEKKVILEWVLGFSPTERETSLNKVIKLIEESTSPDEVIEKTELPKGTENESRFISKLNDSQMYSIYGGKLAKYLLLRIDKELWELENFPGYPGVVTVEHILPRNPSDDSSWVKKFSEEDRIEWTNKLGNLVLLSGRKNSKAQNYEFDKKKNVYFGKKETPFKITQKLRDIPDWDIQALKKRHEDLINVAKTIFLG